MKYIGEAEIDRLTDETGKALAKEKKVTVTIRPEGGETHWEGGINGHFFRIRCDESVEVPESLAKLIALSNAVKVESERSTRAYVSGGGKKLS